MAFLEHPRIALFQLVDFILDRAGEYADQHAGEQQPGDGDDGHQYDIADASILKAGHPCVDHGGYAVPEHGVGLAFAVEAQQNDEQAQEQGQHEGGDNQVLDEPQRAAGDAVVKPVIEPVAEGDALRPPAMIGPLLYHVAYSFQGAMPSFLRTFSIVRWAMAEARSRPESITCCK